KRALQKYVEDEMAEMILRTGIKEGQTVTVDFDNDKKQIVMNVTDSKKIDKSELKD
ncbi:MAG: hypothetical protein GXZ03_05060, partial [Proteiniphilum sp.]|nr:hypothetical protein [Proteiniphilum sp.]